MKRCTFEQIKVFKKRLDPVVMKRIKENLPSLNHLLKKKHGANPKKSKEYTWSMFIQYKKDSWIPYRSKSSIWK